MYNQDEWPALPTSNNRHNTTTEALQLQCKAMTETAVEQKKEMEHLTQLVKIQYNHINTIQKQQQQQQQQQQQLATNQQQQASETWEQQKKVLHQMHNSIMENLRTVRDEVTEELNDQFIENLNDKGEDISKALRQHLDAVMECMDRKFDSHATIAGVETIDETALSVDKEEETAEKAKEEDAVAEEAKVYAQTITIEEDTAMAENASTNIIHKSGIKTVGAETTKDKNEKKGAEAKELSVIAINVRTKAIKKCEHITLSTRIHS